MQMDDEIARLRAVDGLARLGVPRSIGLGVVWKDADHVESRGILELDAADFDAASLKALCLRMPRPGSLIDRKLAEEVRHMLAATRGEFLAGFEDLQHKVTQSNGTAGEVVAATRQLIANQRADLTRALTDYLDATGQVTEAIPHLKDALELLPERQDLARLLVTVYLQTGQTARASELRSSYNLNLEGSNDD